MATLDGAGARRSPRSFTSAEEVQWGHSAEDEVVLKKLREISHKTGIKQQELIAKGLKLVLTKYRKRG